MSVRQLRRKGRVLGWEAMVDFGRDPETGKRARRSLLKPTKAEAAAAERELLQEYAETWGQGTSGMRLGDWLVEWLREVKRTRSQRTWLAWESIVRVRLLPAEIARLKLREVRPTHVRMLIQSWETLPVSAVTRRNYANCLTAAFNAALRDGHITRSPIALVAKPTVEDREPTVLTRQQWEALMAILRADTTRQSEVLLLMAETGCRIGEVLGMTWDRVDLAAGLMVVKKGKTAASNVPVGLTDGARTALERLQRRQERERPLWSAQYVFGPRWLCRGPDGHVLGTRTVNRRYQRFAARLGLPYSRPHDLRHFIATEGLAAGVDMALISKALRHSSVAITSKVYAHLRPGTQRATLERILHGESAPEVREVR